VNEKRTKRKKPSLEEPQVDPASTNNLIGFFALLLEIDRRKNPRLYAAHKVTEPLC
jgi:hypothetical protein